VAEPTTAGTVLGVTITFHPDPATVPIALRAAYAACDGLAVIDNRSTPESRQLVEAALAEGLARPPTKPVHRTVNAANLGVSVAFNQGIRSAIAEGYEFVLLLDQDSVVTPEALAALRGEYRRLAARFPVGAVQGFNVEPGGHVNLDSRRREYYRRRGRYAGEASFQGLLLLNSGSLIPTAVFRDVGLFDERYFADFVDYEFSLRLARRGYAIFHVPSARIEHNVGPPDRINPVRLYYAVRELTRLLPAYGRQFPGGVAPIVWTTASRFGTLLLRGGQPLRVLGLTLRASFDGALGVTGELAARR
jgi:rhamnosyltransferase